MPTPAAADATFASAIATLTGATRMACDFRRDLESITLGTRKFQLIDPSFTIDQAADWNESPVGMALRIDVHHRLGASEAVRDYTQDEMHTHLLSLLNPGWWEAGSLAGTVLRLIDGPALDRNDVVRVGRVISYTVTVAVALKP